MRAGIQITDIAPPIGPPRDFPASWYGWGAEPRSLVVAARGLLSYETTAGDVWRLLVVAEGRDPDLPYDGTAWPLLRRWIWRTALADVDLDVTSGALGVIRDDAAASAVRLLDRTPVPAPLPPGRQVQDTSGRRGRLVLLGPASLHPRDLPTGMLVDIEQLGGDRRGPSGAGIPAHLPRRAAAQPAAAPGPRDMRTAPRCTPKVLTVR